MNCPEILKFQEEDEFTSLLPYFKETTLKKLFPASVGKVAYVRGVVKKVEVGSVNNFSYYYCNHCGLSVSVLQELTETVEPSYCKSGCSKVKWSLDPQRSNIVKGTVYTIIPESGDYQERILVYSFNKYPHLPGSTFEGLIFPQTYYSNQKKTNIEYSISIYEVSSEKTMEDDFLSIEKIREYYINLKNTKDITSSLLSTYSEYKGAYLDPIKRSILYQIISTSMVSTKGASRSSLNILLVGEPGTGKSSLLMKTSKLCGTVLVNGAVSTSAGVIAACKKTEDDGYSLEAGSCILSDRNVLCIDELDKSKSRTIIEELHQPMEQGTVSFNKAGLHLTLNSRVAFLIAMNPEKNSIGPKSLFKQKTLASSFLNRMDLIFYLKENNVSERQNIELIMNQEPPMTEKELIEWKKKISLIKSMPDPTIPEAVAIVIFEYFKLLSQNKKTYFRDNEVFQENFVITIRQREALERLCKCIAKINLREEVTLEDAKEAINLTSSSIYSLFFTSEAELNSVEPSSEIKEKKETATEKMEKVYFFLSGPKTIRQISEALVYPSLEVEVILQRLIKSGKIFCPKLGYYERILSH
jgi:DNA replicative helicase MCM subunit Mcm2 (Cdc46/Mcm family)